MQRCSSSHQGNMGSQCTCGLFHGQTSNSFSMLFSMPPNKPYDEFSDYSSCPFATASSSYSSAVDCTLSLGTPSTRLSNENINNYHNTNSCTNNNNNINGKAAARSSYMPNFCWDILQPKHNPSPPSSHKPTRGGNTNVTADPLLARRCANCDTTSTPLWRNGPRGPKSLCNACGIRFKKEERRATAAATTSTTTSGGAQAESNSWIHHQYSQSSNQKIPCLPTTSFGNEFRFMDHDHDDRDSETGIPFLSWRLNVTDRPGLVHDFTR